MQIAARQLVVAGTFAASAVASLGATAAWTGATDGSWRERIAAAGYLPGFVGIAAAAGGTLALALPVTRPAGRAMVAYGGAAALGMVAGKVAAHAVGIRPSRSTLADADLPALNQERSSFEYESTLKSIDRTAQDIVIWVPGTMRNRIPSSFTDGVKQAFEGRSVSLEKLPTHPDYQVVQGVVDSAEAVRMLVRELDEHRRPGQRILLAGESQGAWAMAVAMEDPDVRDAVDRAVVWGNPGVSPHQFDGAGDGRVLELTDDLDVVGRHVNGDPELVLGALTDFMDGDLTQLWRLPGIAINNAHSTSLLLRSGLRIQTPDGYGRDPHNHREFMGAAARFLADAPIPD